MQPSVCGRKYKCDQKKPLQVSVPNRAACMIMNECMCYELYIKCIMCTMYNLCVPCKAQEQNGLALNKNKRLMMIDIYFFQYSKCYKMCLIIL